jgi:serine/threonine protein kinase
MTEQSAESIFGQAIEIQSDEERSAFLKEACGGDEQLRDVVERLVADHFRAGSFLEQPVIDGDATAAMPPGMEQVGSCIGPYKLRERLGEGGMGVVWAAEQEQPLRRKVALKVIKPGMDSSQVIARFEAEREALALMDHPNIARVLDAGTTDQGRPYFVMEPICGVPITEYCDTNTLTIFERLGLWPFPTSLQGSSACTPERNHPPRYKTLQRFCDTS